MYHCHKKFYFAGCEHRIYEVVRGMAPLEHFTHAFCESDMPEAALAAEADVVLADVRERDVRETLHMLISAKGKHAELIVLADKEQSELFMDDLTDIKDIWIMPMADAEIKFRFFRWQQTAKMEKDYWQTDHYLTAVIDHIPNLIWFKDKDGIHRKVNDSFCRTVNKTKEQVQGQGHAYIWDVEHDDPACIESEEEVMSSKKTCVSEEQIQTGGGTRLLTTYKSPLYDVDGSVMGTVGVAIDVTQERTYEQEIIKKNETLETIFTTIDCGVMRHSIDGATIYSVNRAALAILGYESLEDLIDAGFDMIAQSVLDEDKEKLRQSITKLKNVGDSVSVEYRIQHKSGEVLHIMGNIKLLEKDGERFYQRFLLDCTEQKLQEQKNERQQMELIQALGMDYNLVSYIDLDSGRGFLLRNSDNDRPVLGFKIREEVSLKEIMDFYIQKFVHEDDKEMLYEVSKLENIKAELQEKNQHHVNYRVQIKGDVKYFQMKIVRSGAWNGSHGVVLGFRSIDDEMRSELEKKSLLEDALMQANRASKAKSVFLSNMSHDIRTPMNAIVGFTALAIAHIERRDQVEEYLKKIMTSGNHLLSLINDVLDMSRIESGRIHLDEKLCSLPDILHGLRNMLQADIRAKQLELYIDTVDVFDEDIFCDKLRLNQVLLNLLSNCVKYTSAGGIVSMRITEKAGAPAGSANYEFYIKDNGIGMSAEFVEHIFEPFEREKTSTISGIQGTGLGMAITKNIVDMMNGSIEVRSEQGVGTEFIVCFTFRLNSEPKGPQDIPELKNGRALVVDDDFNSCDSVSYMLQQIGMRAEWTLSGKEAVLRTRQAVMRGDHYCVYIVDWLLPDMNGVEVTRRIRKETGEDVPIIVLTAYDWADIEEEAKEAGVTAFCSKPLFLSELKDCLNSVINADSEKKDDRQEEEQQHHGGRILLAEDVELNQEIAVAILGDAGFSTEVAGNGQIAVDMLKKSKPGYYKVVLMDVQMPVMDGYEATRQIRSMENEKLASIPIIAMTANAFEEDKRAALNCGMNSHIAKPIDVDNLIRTLGEVLD